MAQQEGALANGRTADKETIRTKLLKCQPEVLWMEYKSIYLNSATHPMVTGVIAEVYAQRKSEVDEYLKKKNNEPKWYLEEVGDRLKLVPQRTSTSLSCSEN